MLSLFIIGVVAFLAALVFTPIVRDGIRRLGFVDQPNERKVHPHPIPRAGGIAVALAVLFACGVGVASRLTGSEIMWEAHRNILNLAPAVLLIFLTGLIDDLAGLKPWTKLAGQCAAAYAAFAAGVQVSGIGQHHFAGWVSFLATLFWLLLCSNAVNLIDGIDGLAAGVGLFASATTLIAALLQNNIPLAFATVPLVGALLGFLRYNFNPASIFLGDSGSLLVGFLLGCYGILWSQKSATILGMTAPLLALVIPLLDTFLTIARRFLHHKPIFGADRGHIHHRLLDRGLTPRKAALLLYACCSVGAICSLLVANSNASGWVLVVFCGMTWIGIQHLGYVEFGLAGRMFLEGAFRRQLSSQMEMCTFEQRLAAAASVEDYWPILRAGALEFGFYRVRMRMGGKIYEHRDRIEPTHGWNLNIAFSHGDFVELSRRFDQNAHSTAVAPFADAIWKTLDGKRDTAGNTSPLAIASGA